MAPSALLGQVGLQVNSAAEEAPRFADLDGDGIDDNARDRDFDGIPDAFVSNDEEAETAPALLLTGQMDGGLSMDGAFDQSVETEIRESRADAYASRQFASRDLKEDRGGFDSDADPEKKASQGKVCIGGVCF
jgi:hypothetical protein